MKSLKDKLVLEKNKVISVAIRSKGKVLVVMHNKKYSLPSEEICDTASEIDFVNKILKDYFPKTKITNPEKYLSFEDQSNSLQPPTCVQTYLVNLEESISERDCNGNLKNKIKWVKNYETGAGLSKVGSKMDAISREVIHSLRKNH